jgi:DNA-binding response OmpR family regulator
MRLHLFDHGHRPHLLIVAGNAGFAQALARAAMRGDFETTVVGSRAEALQAKERLHPAGYVIDASLPDGSGADFVRELREARTAEPILFLESLHAGVAKPKADAVITKPVSFSEFREELRDLFSVGESLGSESAPSGRRAPSFHLFAILAPLLLAAGIVLTWWLLSLK